MKSGYQSLVINTPLYNQIKDLFKTNESYWRSQGITSLSALSVNMIEEYLALEKFRRNSPLQVRKVKVLDKEIRVDIADHDTTYRVTVTPGRIRCNGKTCVRDSCMHVGVCYGVPEIYSTLVRLPE